MWPGDQRQGPAVLPREITAVQEAGWAPQPVWTGWRKDIFSSLGVRAPECPALSELLYRVCYSVTCTET